MLKIEANQNVGWYEISLLFSNESKRHCEKGTLFQNARNKNHKFDIGC
jgi:hypothetical protein